MSDFWVVANDRSWRNAALVVPPGTALRARAGAEPPNHLQRAHEQDEVRLGGAMSQNLISADVTDLANYRRTAGTTEGVTSEAFNDLLKAWAPPLGFTFIIHHAFTAKVNNRVDLYKKDCLVLEAKHRGDEACA